MSVDGEVLLGEGQGVTLGDEQLLLHQVDTGDQFRNGVLDLQAGVHLQEVEVARAVEEELHRAGPAVVTGFGALHRRFAHPLPQGGGFGVVREKVSGVGEGDGRGFLHYLLVPPLYGALPFEEVNDVAVLVGQHLDLDVAGAGDVLLDEDRPVAEGVLRLADRPGHLFLDLRFVLDDAHALATPTGCCLDEDRVAHLPADPLGQGHVGDGLLDAGHHRDVVAGHGFFGGQFVAHHLDGVGARTDEGQPRRFHPPGELGVLAKKTVAGVDGVRAGGLRRGDHLVDHQVRFAAGCGAEQYGLVGEAYVGGVAIRFAVHGHGGQAHAAGGAHHAQGDLPPVCDQ